MYSETVLYQMVSRAVIGVYTRSGNECHVKRLSDVQTLLEGNEVPKLLILRTVAQWWTVRFVDIDATEGWVVYIKLSKTSRFR